MKNEDYLKQLKQAYEIQIKAIEDKYQAIIESKNEIIKSRNEVIESRNALIGELKAEIDRLNNTVQLQANQPIFIQISNQSQTGDMSIINQTHSGSGDNVAGDKNTTYNYNHQAITIIIKILLMQLKKFKHFLSNFPKLTLSTAPVNR